MSDASPSEQLIDIPVLPEFHEFIPSAILRLSYILDDVEIQPMPGGIRLLGTKKLDEVQLVRNVNYQIYREKIFQSTLSLRQGLYQMLAV